jgi:hypothetical protein
VAGDGLADSSLCGSLRIFTVRLASVAAVALLAAMVEGAVAAGGDAFGDISDTIVVSMRDVDAILLSVRHGDGGARAVLTTTPSSITSCSLVPTRKHCVRAICCRFSERDTMAAAADVAGDVVRDNIDEVIFSGDTMAASGSM